MWESRRLAAVLVAVTVLLPTGSSGDPQQPPYPPTPRGSVVETFHGLAVADPYRWLEQLDDPGVKEWIQAQVAFSARLFGGLPGRDAVRARFTQLWRSARVSVPWRESQGLYFLRNDGLRPQQVLYTATSDSAEPRVLFDPNDIWPDGSVAARDYVVSPDGRFLAYAAAEGGADTGTAHILETSTGQEREDRVDDVLNSVCWTRDRRGFFYIRAPQTGSGASDAGREKQLRYHLLGRPQSSDRLIHTWDASHRWAYCMTSEDGRWEFVIGERGAESDMRVMKLDGAGRPDADAPLFRLLPDAHAMLTPLEVVGEALYVHTDLDAPRHRVITLNLAEGPAARARTVIPEGPDVIENSAIAGNRIVLEHLVDASSRLHLFSLDGRAAGEVKLPGLGSIGELSGRPSAPELFYSFRSFLAPSTVYRYDLHTSKSSPYQPPQVAFDAREYETRQIFYHSKDGTRIPLFLTSRKGLRHDGANPVLLTGYGGYGASITPNYLPDLPVWLESGGVYAVANLRGGGEYGEAWHRAGMLDKKQNSFDDFIAAAEYLITERYTSSRKLAIYGQSNGGLLVGAVLTQRPDLFAAAVADAGHYDMLRYHKFTAGAAWVSEYGSPDDPQAFRYLREYSPLQHVRSGTCYPATLLLAADHDDRVVPSHSYKFAAALQAAQACSHPVLLRVARDASHSYASTAERLSEKTDVWTFIADALRVTLAARERSTAKRAR